MKVVESSNTNTLEETLDKVNYSNELEVNPIENTPFAIIKTNGEYFGAIGKHRITESYTNLGELEKELKDFSWNRVTQVIWAVVEKYKEILKEE